MLRAFLSRFRPAQPTVAVRAKAAAHHARPAQHHGKVEHHHHHAAAASGVHVLVPSAVQPRNPPVQRQAEVETDNVYTSELLMSEALGEARELHWGGELALSGLSAYPEERQAGPDVDHHLHAGGYQYHVVSQAAAPHGRPVTVHALWEERARASMVAEAQRRY